MIGALLSILPRPLVYGVAAALVAGVGGYVKGCADEHERFVAFRVQVEALGEAAEHRRAQRVKDQARINQEVVRALEKDKVRLARDNAVLLDSVREHARRSVLPPERPPASGDRAAGGAGVPAGVACFARDEFDRGVGDALARFAERAGAGAQRGDAALLGLTACIEWAKRQRELEPKP